MFPIPSKKNDVTRADVKHGSRNLIRTLRRRLGLSQLDLAALIGYGSDSEVSRLENGSRLPRFAEALMLELVLGMVSAAMFHGLADTARDQVAQRVDRLRSQLGQSASPGPRASYKKSQLDRIAASLRRHEADTVADPML
jgi:transcriptional regulator with XRE-family HTH domain